MIIDQLPERIKSLVGYNSDTRAITDLTFSCLRKPLKPGQSVPSKYFAFVSNPSFAHNNCYSPFMWLHCFRDNSWVIGNNDNKYMFPESDFMDEMFIQKSNKEPIYDYCYFTINDRDRGVRYKGFNVFLNSLEVFHNMSLKGVVVVYHSNTGNKWAFDINHRAKKILSKTNIIWKKLNHHEVADVMASSKFCFFPNHMDCSPRMIAESLIRNRPVVVNSQIYGGWHYLSNNGFGRLFDPLNLDSLAVSIKEVLNLTNNQSELWKQHYGFEKSTKKLALLVQKYMGELNLTHLYFHDFKKVFKKWANA